MAFSLFGLVAVALEVLRPILPILIALVVIDLALIAWMAKEGRLTRKAGTLRAMLAVGGIAFVVAALALPPFTQTGFGALSGALDWLALIGGALAIAVAVALLAWPPLQAFRGRQR
jgi:hypothetical protein